jgi:drug/metabolite transporter (DMT)-like permease
MEILTSTVLWMTGSFLFVKSSDYTLVSHAIILSNSGGVFIIVLSLLRLRPVNRLEVIGTMVVVAFSIFSINDSGASKSSEGTNIVLGDLMAMISMPFFACYYLSNTETLKNLPAMIILHLICVFQLVIYTVYFMITSDIGDLFSQNPECGIFGWTSPQFLLISLTLVGPIAGVGGCGSYIVMLDYFPSHVVASIFLLEPLTGQILSVFLGQDNMPGLITYIGILGILIGLGLTIVGDRDNKIDGEKYAIESELSSIHLL